MARNGSGTYSRPVADDVYDTVISETDVNTEMDDIATALTASLAKDGQTTPTANLPMGTYRHTGVGNGSARTDYAALGQVQDGSANWVDGGGTADAITATYSPVITALVDGQLCFVRATLANATTTPTFNPSGLGAGTIVKNGGVALAAGDIAGDGHQLILRYDLAGTQWELLNPAVAAASATVAGIVELASSAETAPGTDTDRAVTPAGLHSVFDKGARVTNSANQSIPNNAFTTLTFNTEDFDTDSIHDNVTNNSRLTATTAGKYLVYGNVRFAANATNTRGVRFLSSTLGGGVAEVRVQASSSIVVLIISTVIDMAAADYIELQAYQNSGGALNSEASGGAPSFGMQGIV